MDVETATAIIVAVAAVVTASATLVLTVLTRGTWKLYQLERSRQRASSGRTAVEILREVEDIRSELQRFGPIDPTSGVGGWPVTARIITRRTRWLNARLKALKRLRDATELGPLSMAHLDVAHDVLADGMGYWRELVELVEKQDEVGYRQDRELIMAHLAAAAGALASAYEALPADVRTWGAEASDYSTLYEAALKENASAFPTAHRYMRSSRAHRHQISD